MSEPIDSFPTQPASWYALCESAALSRRAPLRRTLCGRSLVAFRDHEGRPGVLASRCPHLGADLGAGSVVGGRLQCAYHGWRFDASGACPERGVQHQSYPVAERYGQLFVFLGPHALFPLPSFDDCAEGVLVSARAAKLRLDAPWYMIAAQGFDLQHFRLLHHRALIEQPVVDTPHPFARRIRARFAIRGGTWVDRVTRLVSGEEVEFTVTVWGGNMVLVRTRFRRDRTYGMVVVEPMGEAGRSLELTLIANAERSAVPVLGPLRDAIRLAAKRFAVLHMMSHDLPALHGLQYHPRGLCEDDRELAEYLAWVGALPAPAIT